MPYSAEQDNNTPGIETNTWVNIVFLGSLFLQHMIWDTKSAVHQHNELWALINNWCLHSICTVSEQKIGPKLPVYDIRSYSEETGWYCFVSYTVYCVPVSKPVLMTWLAVMHTWVEQTEQTLDYSPSLHMWQKLDHINGFRVRLAL